MQNIEIEIENRKFTTKLLQLTLKTHKIEPDNDVLFVISSQCDEQKEKKNFKPKIDCNIV